MSTWIFEEHEYNIYIYFFYNNFISIDFRFFLNIHIVDKNTHFRWILNLHLRENCQNSHGGQKKVNIKHMRTKHTLQIETGYVWLRYTGFHL